MPTNPLPQLVDGAAKTAREALQLAPFAAQSADSLGRRHAEDPDPLRTAWERDRDRIVHCTAFRRLMYKTQVFINREADHQRTRLSHSLEVCQVARSIGNSLGLNEPLLESIALAHDIGHPPFGHRGEDALNELMGDYDGFRHNAQVLRVVDLLERRHPDFVGLNLTREVRESLLKHESDKDWPDEFRPKPRQALLEAQVVDMADSTAYNMHDIQDGLANGIFSEDDIASHVELWSRSADEVRARHPGFLEESNDDNLRRQRVTNQLIGSCITDLMETSRALCTQAAIDSPGAARAHDTMLIRHSDELKSLVGELHQFLWERVYHHARLQEFSRYARRLLDGLFEAYNRDPNEMALWYREWAEEVGRERAVCDYLAGMTDRFAEGEFERLTGNNPITTLGDPAGPS
ncbi:MAG: deoxyguanosinetriphosphate triphosphohydrolase [bacterium]|jgi:dGTPase